MEAQTDGVEWVLATLFVAAMIAAVVAGIREILRLRRGDPGGSDD